MIRGLDGAPELAPNVDLPCRLSPERVFPEGRLRDLERRRERHAVPVDLRADVLLLRVELAERDAELGAGLEDADAGGAEREVLLVRQPDQVRERRVGEDVPPVPVFRARGVDRGVVGFEPLDGDVGLGRLEVGADHAAGGQQEREQEMASTPSLGVPPPAVPVHQSASANTTRSGAASNGACRFRRRQVRPAPISISMLMVSCPSDSKSLRRDRTSSRTARRLDSGSAR